MEIKQRLELCKRCEKRAFAMKTGILCSLTERKPEFTTTCDNFLLDAKEAQKIEAKQNYVVEESKSGSGMSTWGIIAVVLLIIRILFRLFRDS